ncbi:uncharacterized protein LOC143028168 isoform X2 [Oratosquilla oratoria]|uniref:uncharacterized protein LOC143028168 isoform X2 n=1 Tax=Oratosquilla oratoria TaxID=337810 RepID=UPI003F777478
MACTGEELLIKLCQQVQEKSRPFVEEVESNFLWLEEIVVEFRKALQDRGPETLLPKTPSAKRARDIKASKNGVETIGEDGDENDPETRSPAAKKSLVGSFENIPVPSEPSPPRRGRAASRIAAQKMKENLKEMSNLHAKKRRPSFTDTESTAEKNYSDKKKKFSSMEKSQENEPIKTDEEKQMEIDEHEAPPMECPKKGTEGPAKRSRSKEQIYMDEKITKYSPVVVLEDSGGGATLATKNNNEDSLEIQKESKAKENSSSQEKKTSTVVNDKPAEMPTLNDTVSSPLKLDSDTEEDVIVTDVTVTTDLVVPETLNKHKTSEEQADAPKKPDSAPDTDEDPSVKEVKSEVPDVNMKELGSDVVVNNETKTDKKSTASIGATESENQDEDTEVKNGFVPAEMECEDIDKREVDGKPERVGRTTRTKTRNAVATTSDNEPVKKMRLTRSKLRHSPQSIEMKMKEDHVAVPSFDLPSSKTETANDETKESNLTEQEKMEDMHPPEEMPKARSTRTKKKVSEGANNRPVRSTRTKQKRLENQSGASQSQDSAICSGGASSEESENEGKVQATAECSNKQNGSTAVQEVVPPRRMTRSKVRQLANTVSATTPSPTKSASTNNRGSFSRDCCTPKSDTSSPVRIRTPTKFEHRPFTLTKGKGMVKEMAVAYQKHIGSAREVEEMHLQDIQVTQSPARATRHSKESVPRRESSTQRAARRSLKKAIVVATTVEAERTGGRPRLNLAKVTPTYSKDRVLPITVHRLENSSSSSKSGSSGHLHSRFKSVNASLSMTKPMSSLACGTPTEIRRHHNILSGMSSFVTKVQPSKPTREEMEEKRQEELRKKMEREEETRRKKDEIVKMKAEEQKRKNEERMKKVREARERKVLEAKEQQERERKLKAERFKEEQLRKKQHMLLKKKAEEDARLQKLKEQEEELQRAIAEQKRKDMLMAALKKKEEMDKKKREMEMERIGREKLELQKLKQREIERHALGGPSTNVLAAANKPTTSTLHKMPVLNETYNAEDDKENTHLNSTYTKPNQELTSSTQVNNSYVLTPQKKIVKKPPAEDYNIHDVGSDDSTDNEEKPKKIIPAWAQGAQLKNAVVKSYYYPPDIDLIFPPYLLDGPELSKIFPVKKKRFYSRTSSAIWSTPPSKLFS